MMTLKDGLLNLPANENHEKTLVVFGDSFSWGSGLAEYSESQYHWPPVLHRIENYSSWPKNMKFNYGGHIAKSLGFNYMNLSMPGCSNDTISRSIISFIDEIPIQLESSYILIGWTSPYRFEISDPHNKTGFRNMSLLWNLDKSAPKWVQTYMQIYKDFIHSDKISEWNSYKSMIGALSYLKLKNANFLSFYGLNSFSVIDINKKMNSIKEMKEFDIAEYSWDYPNMLFPCLHPNEKLHSMIATELLNIPIKG